MARRVDAGTDTSRGPTHTSLATSSQARQDTWPSPALPTPLRLLLALAVEGLHYLLYSPPPPLLGMHLLGATPVILTWGDTV